jgi:hypothetical protein
MNDSDDSEIIRLLRELLNKVNDIDRRLKAVETEVGKVKSRVTSLRSG